MNDHELITLIQDSFSDVRLEIPLDETERRGRALRARQRRHRVIAGAAAAIAIAGVTTVAVTSLTRAPVPAGAVETYPPGQLGHPVTGGGTRLAAWTVKNAADGMVDVTVSQLSDPAGLERTLRADGVPAYVDFRNGPLSSSPGLPTACEGAAISMQASAEIQTKILPPPAQDIAVRDGIALAFDKQAIPKGIGIYLGIQSGSSYHEWGFSMNLVQDSPACTG